jgi:hypothetical protein
MASDTDTALLLKSLAAQRVGRRGLIECRAQIRRVHELITIADALIQRGDPAQARHRLRELDRAMTEAEQQLHTAGNHFSKTRRMLELMVTLTEPDGQ